jgi:putative methyltransferase (TIGR04325 family)
VENRDTTPVGGISPQPHFWGPFDGFQAISQGGFSSDAWLVHCENYYHSIRDASPLDNGIKKLKKIAKRVIGRDFRTLVPSHLERKISAGASVLDIGGGWGDNYYQLKLDGVNVQPGAYCILDSEKQAAFGKTIFSPAEINFLSEIPKSQFDIVLLISTLQYIEDWKSLFATFDRLGNDYVYIARTPFLDGAASFCAVQSLTPPTLGHKIGEENLHIIAFSEFEAVCAAHNWRVKKVSRRQNYSKHFTRMPENQRNVYYQCLMLEKTAE